MKKIAKHLLTILLVSGTTIGFTACDNYDECPPLNEGYLSRYVIPDGVFLSDIEWAQIEEEESEYEDFIKSLTATSTITE